MLSPASLVVFVLVCRVWHGGKCCFALRSAITHIVLNYINLFSALNPMSHRQKYGWLRKTVAHGLRDDCNMFVECLPVRMSKRVSFQHVFLGASSFCHFGHRFTIRGW